MVYVGLRRAWEGFREAWKSLFRRASHQKFLVFCWAQRGVGAGIRSRAAVCRPAIRPTVTPALTASLSWCDRAMVVVAAAVVVTAAAAPAEVDVVAVADLWLAGKEISRRRDAAA